MAWRAFVRASQCVNSALHFLPILLRDGGGLSQVRSAGPSTTPHAVPAALAQRHRERERYGLPNRAALRAYRGHGQPPPCIVLICSSSSAAQHPAWEPRHPAHLGAHLRRKQVLVSLLVQLVRPCVHSRYLQLVYRLAGLEFVEVGPSGMGSRQAHGQ